MNKTERESRAMVLSSKIININANNDQIAYLIR